MKTTLPHIIRFAYMTARCFPMIFAACILTVLLLLPAAQAETQAQARIMPRAAQSLLLDVALAGNRLVAVGERGHVLYSDDDGKSWQQGNVPTSQMLTAVFFVSAHKGWAVGHDGIILLSEDGGENWRQQRDGLAAQQLINLENRETAHQHLKDIEQALAAAQPEDEVDSGATAATAELELALEDAQMDLEDAELTLEEAVSPPPLMDIWFADGQTGWAVGAFGTLLQTTNGGQRWQRLSDALNNPDEYHYYSILGDNQGRVLIAGEAGGLYRSVDGGNIWQTLESPYDGSWFGALHHSTTDTLMIFGLRGNIFRSTDYGDSWQAVSNDNTLSLAGGDIGADGTIVLVGSTGAVLHSADDGVVFEANMQDDRLSLSAVVAAPSGHYFAVGQGGIRTLDLK